MHHLRINNNIALLEHPTDCNQEDDDCIFSTASENSKEVLESYDDGRYKAPVVTKDDKVFLMGQPQ